MTKVHRLDHLNIERSIITLCGREFKAGDGWYVHYSFSEKANFVDSLSSTEICQQLCKTCERLAGLRQDHH